MNTVQLIGRLTRDPQVRYTPSGTATCTIRLAVPRRKRNGEDPAPVYVDVVTFGPQAEAIAEHMTQVTPMRTGPMIRASPPPVCPV
jgi:single-strand DNA-binding protein